MADKLIVMLCRVGQQIKFYAKICRYELGFLCIIW